MTRLHEYYQGKHLKSTIERQEQRIIGFYFIERGNVLLAQTALIVRFALGYRRRTPPVHKCPSLRNNLCGNRALDK